LFLNFHQFEFRNHFLVFLLNQNNASDTIGIYFHSYEDDIGTVSAKLKSISEKLNCNIIAPEFQGFGICFNERMVHSELYKRSQRLFECKSLLIILI